MLRELIDSIGIDVINKTIEEEMAIKNSICLKVSEKGQIDVLQVDKKETIENLELIDWFKRRLAYVEWIDKNKAICPRGIGARGITSVSKYSIIFNYDAFIKKIDDRKKKGLEELSINEILKLSVLDYMQKLEAENEYLNKNIDSILDVLSEYDCKKKKIIIFLDKSVEEYKIEYEKYLEKRLFDDIRDKPAKKIIDETFKGLVGRYSGFTTVNDDKPLLNNIGGRVKEIDLYTKEDVINIFNLKRYLQIAAKTKNKYNNIFLEFNPKDKEVLNYEQDPYRFDSENYNLKDEINLNRYILIEDILSSGIKAEQLTNYSKLIESINAYVDFSLTVLDKNNTKKKLIYYRFNKVIKESIFDEIEKKPKFYIVDKEAFKYNLDKIIDSIIDYNSLEKSNDEYAFFKMKKIINFKICIEDYFYNDGGRERVKNIQKVIKEKIKNYKDGLEFENNNEIMYLAGQLANYLVSKSKATTKTNKLIGAYHKANSYERIITLLKNSMDKYGYDINLNGRENIIFAQLLLNMKSSGMLTNEDKKYFLIGLYDKNIFYIKLKENNKDLENNK